MLRPTRFAAMLLALLLAGSQLALAAHDIEHAATGPDHACAQCLHQPVQKHALPGTDQMSAQQLLPGFEFSAGLPSRSLQFRQAYRSRAPPAARS